MNSTEACIVLNMLPTMGPVRLRKLLEVFRQSERVLTARRDELRRIEGIGNEVAEQISNWESIVDLAAELTRISDFGASVITQESPLYPKSLREIHSPPIVLYVWGEVQERDQHAIGIIGSRRTTHYGTESAKKLSYQLAYAGLTVISGLARGIDTAAHQGALAAKGRTIAVIGSGLSRLYPPENAALAEKIRSGNGANSLWKSNRPPDTSDAQPNHQRMEPGDSDCGSGFEQWRADHRFPGDRAGPFCLRRAGAHQCPERDGIQPPDSARRKACNGCLRYSG